MVKEKKGVMNKILFATSEAVPYIKTGGLADVVGSLPRFFDKKHYDVRIILPKYRCMDEKFNQDLEFMFNFYIDLNWRTQYVGVFKAEYLGVTYYFIDNEYYFNGDKPYNMLHEDVEKFTFFSQAVLEVLPHIGFCPEIIHCNDWQTGMIPVFLRTKFSDDEFYKNIKTIFTIHNLKFQGRYDIETVQDITGLPDDVFTDTKMESYGKANLLKGGSVYSNYVTTVSPTYAKDICTPEGGVGLDGVMLAKGDHLVGIVNGLDYNVYNSKEDKSINYTFDVDSLEEKVKNKLLLQRQLGLEERKEAFMVAVVSRMTDQKGFDIIDYGLDELINSLDIQFVFLGTGEKRYEDMLRYYQGKYPGKVCAYIGYSESIAHKFFAAADAFLMPSLFEPCGLSQIMAMRYGTVPIVRETGGLVDTVEPFNEYENKGTGFTFANYSPFELMDAVRYAEEVYHNRKEQWKDIMIRDMEKDFSWTSSAKEYEKLYNRLLNLY